MAFYKLENGNILSSAISVDGPGFMLHVDNHEGYTYPVHGWYWFDTDEQANAMLSTLTDMKAVSALQLCYSLVHFDLYDEVEAAVAQADRLTQIAWDRASVFHRNSPTLMKMAQTLNITNEQLDEIFTYAATVVV